MQFSKKRGGSPIASDERRNAGRITAREHTEVMDNWWRGLENLGKVWVGLRTKNFLSNKVAYCEANEGDNAA